MEGLLGLLWALLPACPVEDSEWCKWDGATMGNGIGDSFVALGTLPGDNGPVQITVPDSVKWGTLPNTGASLSAPEPPPVYTYGDLLSDGSCLAGQTWADGACGW